MEEFDKNQIVKEVLNKFEGKGLEITHADYGGYQKPDEVNNCRPDVIAWDDEKDLYHIAAVTHAKSFDKNTNKKIHTLSNLMMSKGRSEQMRIPFYLAMPKGELQQVDKILDETNIERTNVLPLEV